MDKASGALERNGWKHQLNGGVSSFQDELRSHQRIQSLTEYIITRHASRNISIFNNNFRFGHGWGGMLNVNFEPTYRTLDRTYHAVYNVNGQIYKTFLGDNLQVALDFTPLGNRRKLDRQAGANKVSYKYTTPVQYVGFSLTWNFSGGKKVDVNVVDGIQDYHETKDNR